MFVSCFVIFYYKHAHYTYVKKNIVIMNLGVSIQQNKTKKDTSQTPPTKDRRGKDLFQQCSFTNHQNKFRAVNRLKKLIAINRMIVMS